MVVGTVDMHVVAILSCEADNHYFELPHPPSLHILHHVIFGEAVVAERYKSEVHYRTVLCM